MNTLWLCQHNDLKTHVGTNYPLIMTVAPRPEGLVSVSGRCMEVSFLSKCSNATLREMHNRSKVESPWSWVLWISLLTLRRTNRRAHRNQPLTLEKVLAVGHWLSRAEGKRWRKEKAELWNPWPNLSWSGQPGFVLGLLVLCHQSCLL